VGSVGTVAVADVVPPDCGVVADAPLAVVDVPAVEAASVDASLQDFFYI
jgi:hypothetical protein